LKQQQKPIVIGITGGSASGKTSVAHEIFKEFSGSSSVLMLQQDSFYKASDLPFEQRKLINYDHPLAFDTPRLIADLKHLLARDPIDKPVYDYKIHNRSRETIHVEPRDVIILEGILILADEELRKLMDIKIFVDTDDDIRLMRRIRRDMVERGRSLDNIMDQYMETVKPMYHEIIEPTKRYADLIIPEGGENHVAIDLLVTKIKSILAERGLA